jgi:hypothetical protein
MFKENPPLLIRGFETTWLDACRKHYDSVKFKRAIKTCRLNASNIEMKIKQYSKENKLSINCMYDVKYVLKHMIQNGYRVTNPRNVTCQLMQIYAKEIGQDFDNMVEAWFSQHVPN